MHGVSHFFVQSIPTSSQSCNFRERKSAENFMSTEFSQLWCRSENVGMEIDARRFPLFCTVHSYKFSELQLPRKKVRREFYVNRVQPALVQIGKCWDGNRCTAFPTFLYSPFLQVLRAATSAKESPQRILCQPSSASFGADRKMLGWK